MECIIRIIIKSDNDVMSRYRLERAATSRDIGEMIRMNYPGHVWINEKSASGSAIQAFGAYYGGGML